MSAPKRIQRKRTKGWRMPEEAAYVGRPTKWGNPYVIGAVLDWSHVMVILEAEDRVANRAHAAALYRDWLAGLTVPTTGFGPRPVHGARLDLLAALSRLAGRDLACWCPLDQPCHADVLLDIANAEPSTQPARARTA